MVEETVDIVSMYVPVHTLSKNRTTGNVPNELELSDFCIRVGSTYVLYVSVTFPVSWFGELAEYTVL